MCSAEPLHWPGNRLQMPYCRKQHYWDRSAGALNFSGEVNSLAVQFESSAFLKADEELYG